MKDLIGKKVLLKPKKSRDAFDMFLAGKYGIVESVEQDFEDRIYVAVVLEDDEGKDLGFEKSVGHRFFFDLDEIEVSDGRRGDAERGREGEREKGRERENSVNSVNSVNFQSTQSTQSTKILIACLGNIFYGDDAFGVEVAKNLLEKDLPENITVRDFGIRGVDLAFELAEEYELVILVDTIKLGTEAGNIFVLEPKIDDEQNDEFSHDLTPAKALQFARKLKAKPKKMLLIGCQPANLEFNDEMSESVKDAVEKAVEKVMTMISDQWSMINVKNEK